MLKALVDFLLNRKGHPVQKDTTLDTQAPYKIEAPVVTPMVVPPEPMPPSGTWPFPTAIGAEKKEEKPAVKAKSTRAKKVPVAAMKAAEKPATEKKPAKPRKPRVPKA